MSREEPWYKNGLHFQCTGCGKCCSGCPGYVWVTLDEICAIADHLNLSVDEFSRRYLRQRDGKYSLVEMKSRNYDCVFLKDRKCQIYQVRPKQCRTFPWWKENLSSVESWKETAARCEGINDQAPHISYEQIQRSGLVDRMRNPHIAIVGGGAAGVFAALAAVQAEPNARVHIIERSSQLLTKVRLSGGGRCNLTNATSPISSFVQNYPRGSKELQGPLHRFGPQQTIDWFESRGVHLKTEADGRVFPCTNSSETIIECLCSELKAHGVEILFNAKIRAITRTDGDFVLSMDNAPPLTARSVILATGSDPSGYGFAMAFGHTISTPVPSLFAFAVPSSPLSHTSGIVIDPVEVSLVGTHFSQRGSLLITHFGFSGPSILKLSSWAARYLHDCGYVAELSINWLPDITEEALFQSLVQWKHSSPHSCLSSHPLFSLPKSFWKAVIGEQDPLSHKTASTIPHSHLREVARRLHSSRYQIDGTSPHREEFVTCGGVNLNEISWKTMESVLCPGLFFAGEILDVDGVTGGFNLQNAWTTGYIAGSSNP